MSKQLFEDPRFRPDGLKIYPTVVVAGTELEKWFNEGRYVPYNNSYAAGPGGGHQSRRAEIRPHLPRAARYPG